MTAPVRPPSVWGRPGFVGWLAVAVGALLLFAWSGLAPAGFPFREPSLLLAATYAILLAGLVAGQLLLTRRILAVLSGTRPVR